MPPKNTERDSAYESRGEKVLVFPAAPAPADTPAHYQRQLCQTILPKRWV
ncbi:MAG TPA: hypothetical protein IGS17_10765 [Oscillatoriales cyanobacterium M59_W2019_021]|nr:hypothetical protein [Oscillatoriales cyanobacterium M4454_W2019_049]HIK51388.1 hypothetical protein [Oscillatoriales cyanobacterium M59_W2019_021]